jgi:hypothetical protein
MKQNTGSIKDAIKLENVLRETVELVPQWRETSATEQHSIGMVLRALAFIVAGGPSPINHWARVAEYANLMLLDRKYKWTEMLPEEESGRTTQ